MSKNKNQNKLGLGIIAFEGTELIAQIVTEIKDLVDYVVVGFQRKSYTGEPCDPNDEKEIQCLLKEGLINEIMYIETDHTDFPRVQETVKRNALVDNMAKHGCTHELIIDSDEFYTHDSFQRAKEKIYNENIEMSYCRYVNYFRDYKHYLVYPFQEGQYVPFIAKINYKFAWQCKDFPLPSDPTRRFVIPKRPVINPKTKKVEMVSVQTENGKTKIVPRMEYIATYYKFDWKELKMHHLSWIRANIRKKMGAWSSKSYFDNYLEIIDKSAERFNNFTEENKNKGTFLLFNTPENKVDIATFNKQYIFPKIDYRTRTHNEVQNYCIKFEKIEKESFSDFIDTLDNRIRLENYKGHNSGEIKTRSVCDCDYLILSTENLTLEFEDKLKDFVNRLTDDSVIYVGKNKKIIILSNSSIEKIRKYAKLEWNINHEWFEGLEETMNLYCKENDLTYNLYFSELPF